MSAERTTMKPRPRAKADPLDPEGSMERLQEAVRDTTDPASEILATGVECAAASVGSLADAADTAASRLRELEQQGLADYTHQLASYLSDMSARLRETSVDGVANDLPRIAQRNPALFVLGSVVVGLTLSRYAAASHDTNGVDASATLQRHGDDANRTL
jgi:hypothetical protein